MYTLEGVSSVANFITAYEESQISRVPLYIMGEYRSYIT